LHVPDFITSKQERCLKDALDESEDLFLSRGKKCYLIRIRNDLIPSYDMLAFPKTHGEPSSAEVREMLVFGVEQAQERAFEVVGDREAFTILYSGYSARREKGWHIQIVLLGSRWKKAWLYTVVAGKSLLQALALREDDAPHVRR
jgi:hypothetical protein